MKCLHIFINRIDKFDFWISSRFPDVQWAKVYNTILIEKIESFLKHLLSQISLNMITDKWTFFKLHFFFIEIS